MKAVILAASPGNALFPLANCLPQLRLPVGNRPLIAHQLAALSAAAIDEVALVANDDSDHYDALICELRRRENVHVDLSLWRESIPGGTAGALRAVERFAGDEDVVLIAGAVFPASLHIGELIAWHRRSGAPLSVVTQDGHTVPYLENVEVDASNRITRCNVMHHSRDRRRPSKARMPGLPERRCTRVAAGVYVVGPGARRLIPDSGYMDLKEQLIPALYAAGTPAQAFHVHDATRPISSLDQLLAINSQLLRRGAAWTPACGAERALGPDVWVGSNVYVSPRARLTGPILIGRNCVIGADARIIGPVVVGDDCTVESGASIARCVVWSGCNIGPGAELHDSLVTDTCEVVSRGAVERAIVVPRSGELDRLARVTPTRIRGEHAAIVVADRGLTAIDRATRHHRVSEIGKRTLDLWVASCGLVALAPVLAAIAATIRLDSPGPAFYKQRRCGKDGREFTMWKFRTMVDKAEQQQTALYARKDVDGPMFKLNEDPRVTRVGRFLRKTSLDELPQLLNVLRGDMSLVGPRPLVMEEMRFAPGWRDMRLQVRPGMSGLWQVNGRSNVSFHDWIRHDIHYVVKRSLLLDLWVLRRTLRALRIGDGAK